MTGRPDGFDAALTAYLPSLRKQARFIAGDNGEDLLQDAILSMLHLAPKCRMETFRVWAQLILRRTAGNNKRSARALKRSARFVTIDDDTIIAQAAQEVACDLRTAIEALDQIKHGEIVVRRAMGDRLAEIGMMRGTHKEAVRQLESKARAKLVKALAA
jgi:RNA polymerase sigma factor (sigma-70 family)